MIYLVFNSNQMLIWGCNLAINKASLILRLQTLRTIVSILMEKLSLFLHLIKCLWNEDACVLRCSLILMWRGLSVLPIYKLWHFKQIKWWCKFSGIYLDLLLGSWLQCMLWQYCYFSSLGIGIVRVQSEPVVYLALPCK